MCFSRGTDERYQLRLRTPPDNKPSVSQWSQLRSPITNVAKPSCLSIEYITSNVNYEVYRYSCTEMKLIINVERFEQKVVYHTITSNMPAGQYGIIIRAKFAAGQEIDNNAIASIVLRPGSCENVGIGLYFIQSHQLIAGTINIICKVFLNSIIRFLKNF